jgi:short-subunit dehydrogenase
MSATALITGASSGIGLAFANIFAKNKINLLLVARSEGKLSGLADELRKQHGITVELLSRDLSSATAAQEIADYCRTKTIAIEYLVNNAGFGDFGMFAESNWEKQLRMINLNIISLTFLTRLFLPEMIRNNHGKILNVASTAAFQPGPTMAVYYATKAYVLHFSEAIANELQGTGVSVTALCPGPTESGFQSAAAMQESKLVKGRKLPAAQEVAAFGYKALMSNKKVAIHGFMNYVMANSVRFVPRNLVVKILRSLQDK